MPGGSSNPNKSHLLCANPTCGKTGHLIADCFQMGGGKQGQYPAWWKGKQTIPPITNFTSSSSTIDGVINPGEHFALSATLNDEVDKLVEENKSVLKKVALAAGQVLPSISSCSFGVPHISSKAEMFSQIINRWKGWLDSPLRKVPVFQSWG